MTNYSKTTLFIHIPKTGGTTLSYILQDHFLDYEKIASDMSFLSSTHDFIRLHNEDLIYISGHIPASLVNLSLFNRKITIIRDPLAILCSMLHFDKKILNLFMKNNILNILLEKKDFYKIYLQFFSPDFDFWKFITEKTYGICSDYSEYFYLYNLDAALSIASQFNYILDFSNLNAEIKRLIINEKLFPYSIIPNIRKFTYTPDIETARRLLDNSDVKFYQKIRELFVEIPKNIDVDYEHYRHNYCVDHGINLQIYESHQVNLKGPIGVGWYPSEKSDLGKWFRWSEVGKATIELPISISGRYFLNIYYTARSGVLVSFDTILLNANDKISSHNYNKTNISILSLEFATNNPDWIIVNLSIDNHQNNDLILDERILGIVLGEVIIMRVE